MKAKLILETLNEISSQEDRWADTEINRWEMEKKGINPLRNYIENVSKLIFNQIDEEIIKRSGITEYIIEDLITDDELLQRNVYSFYEDAIPEKTAAVELGLGIENFMMEQL